jgi:hypothetical protein
MWCSSNNASEVNMKRVGKDVLPVSFKHDGVVHAVGHVIEGILELGLPLVNHLGWVVVNALEISMNHVSECNVVKY